METEKVRIQSIDILRGLIMIIMALDHTRDFFHVTSFTGDPMNPENTYLGLYFTRWITHFCAPTFVFLSGLSAFLSAQKKSDSEAGGFLIKRGFWLLFIEIAIITLGLTFNPFYNFIILQVIWSIGWSMILLGICMKISRKLILPIGLTIFFGHNILNYVSLPPPNTFSGTLIGGLLTAGGTIIPVGKSHFIGMFYTILPWTGAMFLGFSLGKWYQKDFAPALRKRNLLLTGISMFVMFLVLRYFNTYGNPFPRQSFDNFAQTAYSFFNVSKYPPSLQYYGMTLGLSLIFLALSENWSNKLTNIFKVYGSVPFFYYVLHFYIIHGLCAVLFFVEGYGAKDIVNPQSPFLFKPDGFGYSLPWVYVIWLAVVASLYQPCVWFRKYKATHRQWWLSYL